MADELKPTGVEPGGVRGEVTACPTGLSSGGPGQPPGAFPVPQPDAEEVHGPLEVEKLEPRQGADDEEE